MTGKTLLAVSFAMMPTLICGWAHAQDNVAAANLAAAKELSAASGRPIFAIAGQST